MKIFILEDDDYKRRNLLDVITKEFPNVNIVIEKYLNISIKTLLKGNFDYAILDNQVSRFSDSRDFVTNAAEEVLEWMYLKQNDTKCIICSSENVDIGKYDNLIGVVKYSTISVDWTKQLINYLKQ